jgi:hypothetical protein
VEPVLLALPEISALGQSCAERTGLMVQSLLRADELCGIFLAFFWSADHTQLIVYDAGAGLPEDREALAALLRSAAQVVESGGRPALPS